MAAQMLFKSLAQAAIDKSLLDAKPILDEARKLRALRALRYCRRDTQFLVEDLTKTFEYLYEPGESREIWTTQPKTAYSIAAACARKLSTTYHDPVKREWQDAALQKVYEAEIRGPWTHRAPVVDWKTFATSACFVRPLLPEPGKPMSFAVYSGDQLDVTLDPDNPGGMPLQVVCSWNAGQGEAIIRHKLYFTASQILHTADDTVIPDEAYPNGIHGYGRIPGVFFLNDPGLDTLIGEPATELVMANLTLNRGTTLLNETADFQGQSLMVVEGDESDTKVKIGARRKVGVPLGGKVYYAQPDAPIEKVIDAVNFNLSLMCKSYDIPDDTFLVQLQGQSGVAIVAKSSGLMEYRKARIRSIQSPDQELMQVALLIREVHKTKRVWGSRDLPPAPSTTFTVPRQPMDAEARAELAWKVSMNAATPIDILLAENPDLDPKKVLETIQENARINALIGMQDIPFEGSPGGGRE